MMVQKTKPKEEYGYYCELCGCRICKYKADFKTCWGISAYVKDKDNLNGSFLTKDICHDCAKEIMEQLLDLHDL